MTWNSTWPDTTKSVAQNGTTGVDNTNYIETEMNKDHYWNNSTNNDGHHKFVQMPQQGTPASPTNPTLATGMDGNIYLKAKSTTESLDNQGTEIFFKNNKAVGTAGTTQIMQMLGIRACALFDIGASPTFTITIRYSHNISSITQTLSGTRFTANFTTALPSNNYLFFANGIYLASPSNPVSVVLGPANATPITGFKSTTLAKFYAIDSGNNIKKPDQIWFVCFGG